MYVGVMWNAELPYKDRDRSRADHRSAEHRQSVVANDQHQQKGVRSRGCLLNRCANANHNSPVILSQILECLNAVMGEKFFPASDRRPSLE